MTLSCARIAAPAKATASVIFMHGLGDTSDGWSFLPPEVHRRPELRHINFVLPNAPVRAVTAFGGEEVPAWFDVFSFGGKGGADVEGLLKSMNGIKEIIQSEIASGIPASRIVVGGFSQGAALTEATAVTFEEKLAGFIPVSGYLPIIKELQGLQARKNQDSPVMMLHGTADTVVPYKQGVASKEILESPKFEFTNLVFHSYEGLAHALDPDGLQRILEFLQTYLPGSGVGRM